MSQKTIKFGSLSIFLLLIFTTLSLQASGRPLEQGELLAQHLAGMEGPEDRAGFNPFSPGSGNLKRTVTDLSVGSLTFARHINSRFRHHQASSFGSPLLWRHNLEFELRGLRRGYNSHAVMLLCYPNGKQLRFQAIDTEGLVYAASPGHGDRLYRWKGAYTQNNGFTLVEAQSNTEYYFERSPLKASQYRLIQVRSAQSAQHITLDYNNLGLLTQVTAPSGRFLQIHYLYPEDHPPRIYKVQSSDGRSVTYDYTQWGENQLWVLNKVLYPENIQAHYTYVSSLPEDKDQSKARPLLASAIDPMVGLGPEKGAWAMRYLYNYAAGFGLGRSQQFLAQGILKHELHYFTDEEVASIPYGAGQETYTLDGKGDGTHRLFLPDLGRLAQRKNRNGHITSYLFDQGGHGYLKSVIHPDGTTTHYTRDAQGRVLTETNALGQVTSFEYNERGFLVKKTDHLGYSTLYQRNDADLITLEVSPGGIKKQWVYDDENRLLSSRNPHGGWTHYTYYSANEAGGMPGDLKSITNPDGGVSTFTYYPSGKVKTATNPLGHTTTFEYNARGLTTLVTHPDGATVSTTYDARGNQLTATDALGHTTTQVYDTYNRRTEVTNALGQTTTFTYGSSPGCSCSGMSMVATITTPDGLVTAYTYDKEGQRTSTTLAYGTPQAATTTTTYDSMGRKESSIDALGATTTSTYDAIGRKKTLTDALGRTTTWDYHPTLSQVTITRPDGLQEITTGSPQSQSVERLDAAGGLTLTHYNHAGQKSQITDPRGLKYRFHYDLSGRQTRMIYPDGTQESTTYTLGGQVHTATTRAGEVATYHYNSRGWLADIDHNGADTPDIEYDYDQIGRLTLIDNGHCQITRTYNPLGQMLTETQHIAGQLPRTFTTTYQLGRKESLTTPAGTQFTYTHTLHGHPETISWNGQPLATYAYDLGGQRTSKTLANGVVTTYHSDLVGRLEKISHQFNPQQHIAYTYGYDDLSRRLFVQRDATLTDNQPKTDGDRYHYDNMGQLLQVAYRAPQPAISDQGAQDWGIYQYDLSGNRRSSIENGGQNSALYSAAANANTYTAIGAITPDYDANGNLTHWGSSTYVYNAKSQLIGAATPDHGKVDVTYDGLGRCISRTSDSGTLYFYYQSGWNLSEERNEQGELVAAYAHGPGIDEIVAQERGGHRVYPQRDGLGSVAHLTDAQGLVIENYAYTVYGEASLTDWKGEALEESIVGNRFRFAGREWVAEMGLYQQRHRYYHAGLGRFMQHDPIVLAGQDLNLYRYVKNNPINAIDPMGLAPTSAAQQAAQIDRMCEFFRVGVEATREAMDMSADLTGLTVEFCGQICSCPMTGSIQYSGPVMGDMPEVAFAEGNDGSCYPGNAPCPEGWEQIADYHTHPGYEGDLNSLDHEFEDSKAKNTIGFVGEYSPIGTMEISMVTPGGEVGAQEFYWEAYLREPFTSFFSYFSDGQIAEFYTTCQALSPDWHWVNTRGEF